MLLKATDLYVTINLFTQTYFNAYFNCYNCSCCCWCITLAGKYLPAHATYHEKYSECSSSHCGNHMAIKGIWTVQQFTKLTYLIHQVGVYTSGAGIFAQKFVIPYQ